MPKTIRFLQPLLTIFAILALALIAAPHPAAAQGPVQAPGWQPSPLLVAQKKRQPPHDGRIIACRPEGCFRIPLGCYTTPEYDFWDNPTGYDKIICPHR